MLARRHLLWLTALLVCLPFVARAAFDAATVTNIFSNPDTGNFPAGATGQAQQQSVIDVIFSNRAYVVILITLTAAGVFSLVYGGVMYITSNGDTEKATKSRLIIIYSIVGVVVTLGLFFLLNSAQRLGGGVATNQGVQSL